MTSLLDNPTSLRQIVYSIYCITNSVSGKKYVGQTKQRPKERWDGHVLCAKNGYPGCRALSNAIRKYGRDAFLFEVVEVVLTRQAANERESYWIRHFNTLSPNGYNLIVGGGAREETSEETRRKFSERRGENSPTFGKKWSQEQREKIIKAKTGMKYPPLSEEHRKMISVRMKGRKHSEATKHKIREAQLGHKQSEETRRKISATRLSRQYPPMSEEERRKLAELARGRKHSEAAKQKIREAKLGKPHTAETRAKLREANLGKSHTDTTKAKMRVSHLGKGHTPESAAKISAAKKAYWAEWRLNRAVHSLAMR